MVVLGTWYCPARADSQFVLYETCHHFLNQGSAFQGKGGRPCVFVCLHVWLSWQKAAGLPTRREFSWEVARVGIPGKRVWLSVKVCFDALCISEVVFLHSWVLRRLADADALIDRCTTRGTKWPMYPVKTVLRLQVSRTHPRVTGYFSSSGVGNSLGRLR